MADKVDHGPRIGADPELFVQTLEGQVVPVCGKVGGTKEQPQLIDQFIEAVYGPELSAPRRRDRETVDRRGNYAVQEDNVMLEFNTPAYGNGDLFMSAIGKALTVLESSILFPRGLSLKYEVVHTFKPDDLVQHPQAFTIGCMPDMNAYAEEGRFERAPFNTAHFGNYRFCGGHIHVQYNHDNVPRHVFAQFMDLVAELPFLRYDRQRMRRMFYGQPGIYREKSYGIEYRTPSNYWLSGTFREKWLPQLVENIFVLARSANINPKALSSVYTKVDWVDVQEAIKTEDAKMADEILEHVRRVQGDLYIGPSATR